jgi:histidinol-phosphatase (PHP family)
MNHCDCYRADYHIHTHFSNDAPTTLDEQVQAAIASGLQEIAITDHYEIYGAGVNAGPARIADRIKFHRNAVERYHDQIIIRHGIELGQSYLDPDLANAIVQQGGFDYIIGSCHLINGIDMKEIDLNLHQLIDLTRDYIREIRANIELGLFDCVGHFDFVKRHATGFYDMKTDFLQFRDQIADIFDQLVFTGKGLEINTSGYRQPPKEAMPGIELLRFFRERGGEIITIGSDAHRPRDVGRDIMTAQKLAAAAGFKAFATYRERQPIFHDLSPF